MKMRYVSLAVILGCGVGSAQAEDLILDGQNIPLEAGSSVSINPVSGDITASSQNGNLVCTDPGSVSVNNFSVSPNPVDQGQQVTMSWSSTNASSCSALGTLPGWSGASIGAQGPFSFTVSALPDTYTARVECTNGGDSATSQTVDVVVEEGDPDLPVINSWSANPTTVEAGDSIQFSWSTTDANDCQAAGNLPGWSGSKPTQGPQSINVPAGTGANTYQARLSCSNAAGSTVSNNVSITVQEGTITGCDNRPPPSGMTRDTGILLGSGASTLSWTQIFGHPFPVAQNTREIEIEQNKYAAIEFTTGSLATIPDTISMVFDRPSEDTVNGPKVVSISECPGDFGDEPLGLNNRCRWEDVRASSFQFGKDPGLWDCPIEANTTYYLNIVYSSDLNITPDVAWFCPGPRCGNIMFAPGGGG